MGQSSVKPQGQIAVDRGGSLPATTRATDRSDRFADTFRSGLDLAGGDVSIPQGYRKLPVTKKFRHRRQRNAVQDSMAGVGMPQIVQTHILDVTDDDET